MAPADRLQRPWDDAPEREPEPLPEPPPDAFQAEIARLQRQIAENEAQQERIRDLQADAQHPAPEPQPHYPRRNPLFDKQF
jgi:hypothetical protein